MADFSKRTSADSAADNPGIDMGTSARRNEVDWGTHDDYWREHFSARPYAKADRHYEYYQPAYKYGHEAAFLFGGRPWDEIDHDLEIGWDQARGESTCSWAEVKSAVRDAYERSLPAK